MQKLESEPQIETHCFHPSFDNLRSDFNAAYFDAWKKGETQDIRLSMHACEHSKKLDGLILE